jgi:hypothetical protein
MKKFNLLKSFHRGNILIHAGVYRVPRDMAEDVAARAQRDGLGEWIAEPKSVKAELKSAGLAQENKMLEVPADKATFSSTGSVKGLVKGHRGGQRAVADD